ncbi:MAG: hypothetical protein IPL53_22940 [Ignavibacteria bacterium]|nr:hypothetical protein [Ignavibacteria bacterium]
MGIIIYTIGIFVNYLFAKYFGFYGVSIGGFVVNSLMAISLIYFSKNIFTKLFQEISDSLKLIFAGFLVALLTVIIKNSFLDIYFVKNSLSSLLIGSVIVVLIYFIFTIVLKVNYFGKLTSLIRHEN